LVCYLNLFDGEDSIIWMMRDLSLRRPVFLVLPSAGQYLMFTHSTLETNGRANLSCIFCRSCQMRNVWREEWGLYGGQMGAEEFYYLCCINLISWKKNPCAWWLYGDCRGAGNLEWYKLYFSSIMH